VRKGSSLYHAQVKEHDRRSNLPAVCTEMCRSGGKKRRHSPLQSTEKDVSYAQSVRKLVRKQEKRQDRVCVLLQAGVGRLRIGAEVGNS